MRTRWPLMLVVPLWTRDISIELLVEVGLRGADLGPADPRPLGLGDTFGPCVDTCASGGRGRRVPSILAQTGDDNEDSDLLDSGS
jgi:hypothetical protein